MIDAGIDDPSWEELEVLQPEIDYEGRLWISPIFEHIGFTHEKRRWKLLSEDEDAFLRFGENNRTPKGQNRFLWDHPIACRSFAFFPPIRAANLIGTIMRDGVTPSNVWGLTVWDVQLAVRLA